MEEEWRPIPDYEGYEVSNLGRIRNTKSGYLLTGSRKPAGYRTVGLMSGPGRARTTNIHPLVLKAFVGQPQPGEVCRHLDGNPANNRVENLRWGTQRENLLDRRDHGTARNQNTDKTVCKRGHALTPDNIRMSQNGKRNCRQCDKVHTYATLARRAARALESPTGNSLCSLAGCEDVRYGKGLCRHHYDKARRAK